MSNYDLIAWSRRTGRRDQAMTHLVSHIEAARTACGRVCYADWWSIAKRKVGEPTCPACVRILTARLNAPHTKESP